MSDSRLQKLLSHVRDVPDFPKPGILFKDVTPLLADVAALSDCLALLTERNLDRGAEIVAGIESRGFIFGAALAARLGAGFVPLRKPGKLPWRSIRETYQFEYGTDALEMHEDAVDKKRVLIVDDLLATGGTAAAAARLVERGGGRVVGFSFVLELGFLPGRKALASQAPIDALITI